MMKKLQGNPPGRWADQGRLQRRRDRQVFAPEGLSKVGEYFKAEAVALSERRRRLFLGVPRRISEEEAHPEGEGGGGIRKRVRAFAAGFWR